MSHIKVLRREVEWLERHDCKGEVYDALAWALETLPEMAGALHSCEVAFDSLPQFSAKSAQADRDTEEALNNYKAGLE